LRSFGATGFKQSENHVDWISHTCRTRGSLELFELVAFAVKHEILLVNDNPYSFVLNDNPMSLLQVEER
jgi:hypothetical protein